MQIPPAIDPVSAVQEKFPDGFVRSGDFRDETTIVVTLEALTDVCEFLRSTTGLIYNFLSDISAVDYYPDPTSDKHPERFGVSYHIYSMLYNRRLRVKAYVPEEEPQLDTVVNIWPAANWLEREIADMMGITFEGNPDQRRLLMPDDWDGHPHRRDYPLGKETVQFSFNVEEILKHKPAAQE